jgi:hypothetical protein
VERLRAQDVEALALNIISMTDQNYAFRDMLGILLRADWVTLRGGQGIGHCRPSYGGGHKDLSRKNVKSFELSVTTA